MVLAFRKLNEKKIGDSYSIPNMIEILEQLGSGNEKRQQKQ